jgi:hypothetical protein
VAGGKPASGQNPPVISPPVVVFRRIDGRAEIRTQNSVLSNTIVCVCNHLIFAAIQHKSSQDGTTKPSPLVFPPSCMNRRIDYVDAHVGQPNRRSCQIWNLDVNMAIREYYLTLQFYIFYFLFLLFVPNTAVLYILFFVVCT